MADRDLELNSLSRFVKDSPHLIREEYGNCEVPAGCGGVVLRWRNPDAGVPVPVKLYAAGECRVYLDGAPLTEGRPLIPFGDHQLAFALTGVDPRYLMLLFAAVYQEGERDGIRRSRPTGEQVAILSAADGTWKWMADPPRADDWLHHGYDDSAWAAMVQNDTRPRRPDPEAYDPDEWRINAVTRLGAVPLGIPTPLAGVWERLKALASDAVFADRLDLWIRKSFTLTRASEGPRE